MTSIVFDMDGVLLDTERVMQVEWKKAALDLGFERYKEAGALAIGLNRAAVKQMFAEKFPEVDYQKFRELNAKYIHEYLGKYGVPIKNGVKETLEKLKSNGVKLAVATSTSSEPAERQLREVGIYDLFDAVMTGDDVEKSKPDPEIYLKACDLISADPKDTFAVEDSGNGLESAYRAGMKTVFIPDVTVLPDKFRKYIDMEILTISEFGDKVIKKLI